MSRMQHITLKFGEHQVAIRTTVIQNMAEFCQYDPASREGCGILLGYEWDQFFDIVAATPPQITDQRSRCSYKRGTRGHLSIAKDLWRKSGNKIGYLGEWHTHPQRIPTPSHKDLSEALKISCKNAAPILSLILGTTHGCGFMAFANELSHVKRFRLQAISPQPSSWRNELR